MTDINWDEFDVARDHEAWLVRHKAMLKRVEREQTIKAMREHLAEQEMFQDVLREWHHRDEQDD